MVPFFFLVGASMLIWMAIIRLGQTYTAGTPFGAALAWFH